MQTRSLINFLPALSFCTIVFFPNSDSLGLLTLKADGRRGVHGGGVSIVPWWCLGGVSVASRWCLGGISVVSLRSALVVSLWCFGAVSITSWWCLGGAPLLSR